MKTRDLISISLTVSIFTILFFVGSGYQNQAYAEVEPNDSFEDAIPLDVGLPNGELNATLTVDDLDYYKFEVVEGGTYVLETFNIQGREGESATGLWLYNLNGTLLANDQYGSNGTGNANARIVYTFATGGTYYLLVKDDHARSFTWTGTYSLRVLPKHSEQGAEWDLDNDSEPNDVLALANELKVGLNNAQTHQLFPHSTFVTNNSDFDFYYFAAEAGRTYVIETFNIQGNGTGSATGLWLYDADGTPLANDQYGDNGTANANARITYTFTTKGTYYLLVKDDNARSFTWTGTYSLRILPKHDEEGAAWDSNNDNEPNDKIALANELKIGLENAQTHQLLNHNTFVTNNSDFDFYHFETEEGRTYIIETFNIQGGEGGSATGLWLYDDDGTLIADDQYGDNGTGNANARIAYTFTTAGTYYLLVKDDNARSFNWTGTYSVRILSRHDEEGAAWDSNNDNEPNDRIALANELKIGLDNAETHDLFDHSSFITASSDHDFYHFEAQEGQTYLIETFDIQKTPSNSATGLWLFDSAGNLIANDQYGSNGTGDANARITFTFTASGTYYLLVKDDNARSFTWTGAYSIRILEKPTDLTPIASLPSEQTDFEPNDVIFLAKQISIGSDLSETHQLFNNSSFTTNSSDHDFYKFNAEANKTYAIETFDIQASTYATGLWLYDSTGTLLDNNRYGNREDGTARIEFTFLTTGEYFFLVRNSDSNRNWTGIYSVRVCETNCLQQIYLPTIIR
ncbi:MAG: PPC domain-containing protein [Chloroflexota bacterium]